jgi:hypothetical protein
MGLRAIGTMGLKEASEGRSGSVLIALDNEVLYG